MSEWKKHCEVRDDRATFYGSNIRLVLNCRRKNSNQPSYLVLDDNNVNLGALWPKTARNGEEFLSGEIIGRRVTIFWKLIDADEFGLLSDIPTQVVTDWEPYGETEEPDELVQDKEPIIDDWWNTLGLAKFAGPEEIKRAWRKLVLKNHPDQGGKHEDFIAIQRAYELGMTANGVRI